MKRKIKGKPDPKAVGVAAAQDVKRTRRRLEIVTDFDPSIT